MDGSSKDFVQVLQKAVIVIQSHDREYLEIDKAISYTDPVKRTDISVLPSDRYRLTCIIDYQYPWLGTQYFTIHSISDFAKEKTVREHVYSHLREFSENRSTVIDGRDIGTVVFPNADFKFFLYAKPEIRAKRRFSEINKDDINYDSVLDNLNYRDITDSTRKIAPLKKAYDAHSIDVSDLSIDQVFEKVLSIIEK